MNFNEIINRKNTGSIKWDMMEQFQKPLDVLPLWVADMDFKAPIGVLNALSEVIEHGVFGYTTPRQSYYEAVVNWMRRRHDWQIKKDWIIVTPGVVPIIHFIVAQFTKPLDSVLIQRPVYSPFTDVILDNGRTLVNSSLEIRNGRYEIDFIDFEKKIIDNQVKLFILCNPHNPIGRVWTKEELITIGDICLKYNVLVVVDEIHHDLVFKKYKHIPFASLGHRYGNNCITCTAPSKTFNLGGLKVANIIVENQEIFEKLTSYLESIDLIMCNTFGIIGCESAYLTGETWLNELMDYIESNKKYVQDFITKKLPMIKVIDSEATYLLWIDFRGLGLNKLELENFLIQEAKLWLNHGDSYGEEGSGFQRLNLACSHAILEDGLVQLEKALFKRNDYKNK